LVQFYQFRESNKIREIQYGYTTELIFAEQNLFYFIPRVKSRSSNASHSGSKHVAPGYEVSLIATAPTQIHLEWELESKKWSQRWWYWTSVSVPFYYFCLRGLQRLYRNFVFRMVLKLFTTFNLLDVSFCHLGFTFLIGRMTGVLAPDIYIEITALTSLFVVPTKILPWPREMARTGGESANKEQDVIPERRLLRVILYVLRQRPKVWSHRLTTPSLPPVTKPYEENWWKWYDIYWYMNPFDSYLGHLENEFVSNYWVYCLSSFSLGEQTSQQAIAQLIGDPRCLRF
jgi:hypothetical protein